MIRRSVFLSTRMSDTVVRETPARLSFRLSEPIICSSSQKLHVRYVDSTITNSVYAVTDTCNQVDMQLVGGVTTRVLLDVGQYTADTFVTMFNAKLTTAAVAMTVAYDAATAKLSFTNTAVSGPATLISGTASPVIGTWPKELLVPISSTVPATCMLDLAGPKVAYLCTNMWTNSLDSRSVQTPGQAGVGNSILAAIPLTAPFGTASHHQNTSDVKYQLPHRSVDYIDVVLCTPQLDELAQLGEWEVTLEFTVL